MSTTPTSATSTTAHAGASATSTTTTGSVTRPIHPLVMNTTKYNRSIEFVTFANLFNVTHQSQNNDPKTPNIVTASSDTLCVYSICPNTKQLVLYDNYSIKSILSHLAGTIISLSTIPLSSSKSSPDALLLGFGGHPRCVVLTLVPISSSSPSSDLQQQHQDTVTTPAILLYEWQVATMIDLSFIMTEYSLGATTIYEQDMIIAISSSSKYTSISGGSNDTDSRSEPTAATTTTACCILGGGIAVAMITFHYQYSTELIQQMIITADEPYIVPLAYLNIQPYHHQYTFMSSSSSNNIDQPYNHGMIHQKAQQKQQLIDSGGDPNNNNNSSAADSNTANPIHSIIGNGIGGSSIPTGFGCIIDTMFLHGYIGEPVIVLIHTQATNGGIPSMGRITKHSTTSTNKTAMQTTTKAYYYCTALSISTIHQRTAILWSVPLPPYIYDALYLTIPPSSSSSSRTTSNHASNNRKNESNCFVLVANNSMTFINSMDGTIQQSIAVNGWAGANYTVKNGSNSNKKDSEPNINSQLRCNPIMKLSIQLEGSTISWVSSTVAILWLRYGQMYIMQQYNSSDSKYHTCNPINPWYILPLQYHCTSIGEIATASNMIALFNTSSATDSTNSDDDNINKMNRSEGYVLAGSRLGNSLWLQMTFDTVVPIPKEIQKILIHPHVTLEQQQQHKEHDTNTASATTTTTSLSDLRNGEHTDDDEVDDIIRIEDEALYGTSRHSSNSGTNGQPDVVPPSDDDDDTMDHKGINDSVSTMMVVRSIIPIDCIVNVGPLGPSCCGPIDRTPPFLLLQNNANDTDDDNDIHMEDTSEKENPALKDIGHPNNSSNENSIYGATADIYPSGYGSSGGIAYMTIPGRDDRMIISETDCLYTDCIFALSHQGIVLLGMSNRNGGPGGFRILKQQHSQQNGISTGINRKNIGEMKEIYVEDWCSETIGEGNTKFADSWEVFQSTLLSASEYNRGQNVVLVVRARDSIETSAVIIKRNEDMMEIVRHHRIELPKDHLESEKAAIIKVSPISNTIIHNIECAAFGCVWSCGDASLVTIDSDGNIVDFTIHGSVPTTEQSIKDEMDVDYDDYEDEEAREIEKFYRDTNIIAIDTFQVPIGVFESKESTLALSSTMEVLPDAVVPETTTSSNTIDAESGISSLDKWNVTYDPEDEELYSRHKTKNENYEPKSNDVLPTFNAGSTADRMDTYFAIYRKLGNIDVHSVSSPGDRIWTIHGTSLGLPSVRATRENVISILTPIPRSHVMMVEEIRFFTCGPTRKKSNAPSQQSLCFSIVTAEGDLSLYTFISGVASSRNKERIFRRIPLGSVARVSQEQIRHKGKLSRKGYLSKNDASASTPDVPKFLYNVLSRFSDISGQDGLFAALARPQWLVYERGQITTLDHRMRHAAPAGGAIRPITCFTPIQFNVSSISDDIPSTEFRGYITLHERIGRVGSQRITLFKGLSNVFESQGILLGNGCCMEKVLLGVTVRRIVFIDDDTVSSGEHPLYALLVSREVDLDQSELNTDGLSDMDRLQKEKEREAMKIQKQVEADLYGYDMESEWVEYIERENSFPIRNDLGGAPPIHQSIYSLWIVDAANKWMVIDSFELGEHEYGIDVKIMYLTEFQDDTGSITKASQDPNGKDEAPKRLFIAMGTGIVSHDGEDVNTKGRVLLFDIKRTKAPASGSTLLSSTTPYAELTLVHEKNIFHGPVTSISCLISDHDKRRLVIGAGSDINIEMWNQPQNKLIQVGFFRATMHILDIVHFKNFLLLSDAYDSIYLLVFRESDKSLTLLAKDYDPIPVYATGIMTRGSAMTFVCHDDRQNLQFFQYAPGEAAARGGNKLVCRADFHLGKQTTSFRTHYCRPSLLIHSATTESTLSALKQQDPLFGRQDDDQRIGVNFGTSDGNVLSIIPLSEPVYWRLMALQSVMSNALESDCVLNHRAWRLYRRSVRRGGCRNNDRKKGVIDGDLIMKYPDLPITVQEDLASAIGSTVGLILDNLLEAQCASMTL